MDIFAFVLEDEEKFQSQIFKALRKVNPQVKVRFFNTLEDFSGWIAEFIKDGAKTVENAGFRLTEDTEIETVSSEKIIRLLVMKAEAMGLHSASLISKTVELFTRKGVCSAEEQTSVVVTAFDRDDFQIKPMEIKFINNIIFKPFDTLILEEHTRYAFVGHKKPNDVNFASNKLEAQVEMIKDIPCEGYSDLGFLTVADTELKPGDANKYYSNEFASGNVRSVMAKCIKSMPRAKGLSGYLCWMEYFALGNEQIKKFRKEIVNEYPMSHLSSNSETFKKNILILDSLDEEETAASLRRAFPRSIVFYYTDWQRFMFDSSPESSGLIAEKDIPLPFGYTLTIDGTGHFIIDQEPKSEIELVFGERFTDLKKKNFHDLLSADSKRVWMDLFRSQKVTPGREPILVFENMGKIYIVRLNQMTKAQNSANLPIWQLKLSEIHLIEKLKYLKERSPLSSKIDVVIASEVFMKQVVATQIYPNAKRVLMVPARLSDKEKKQWSALIYDILEVPLDRNYLIKKIYHSFLERFAWTVKHFNEDKEGIQSAQQIQIDEISEAGLVFKYPRPLSISSFRRLYLWTPNEFELRDYHASCNYVEEIKEPNKTVYNHHFVFFAMKDFYLKNIRLWVRENYIQSKLKNEG